MIEVITVGGILGVVALGTATLTQNTALSHNGQRYKAESDAFQQEVRASLAAETACFNTFGPLLLQPGQEYPITSIKDGAPGGGAVRYQTGSVYGDRMVRLAGLNLMNYRNSPTSPTSGEAVLRITTRAAVAVSGPNSNFRDIIVRTEKDASGRLTKCLTANGTTDGLWMRYADDLSRIYYSEGNVDIFHNLTIGQPKANSTPAAGLTVRSQNPARSGMLLVGESEFADDMVIESYGNGSHGPAYRGHIYGGTEAAPTAITGGSYALGLGGSAFSGTQLVDLGSLKLYALDTLTTSHRSDWVFQGNDGTNLQDVLRIKGTGQTILNHNRAFWTFQVEPTQANDMHNAIGVTGYGLLTTGAIATPHFIGAYGRGTKTSPSPPLAGDQLAVFDGRGVTDPHSPWGGGGMRVIASENHDINSRHGTRVELVTIPNGSRQATPKVVVEGSGNVGIGTETPQAKLHVVGGTIRGGFECTTRAGPWSELPSVANCMADEFVMSGGGMCERSAGFAGPTHSPPRDGVLHASYPTANGWTADCYSDLGPGPSYDTYVQAYAVCCKK